MQKLTELLADRIAAENPLFSNSDAYSLVETILDDIEPREMIPAIIDYLESLTNDMGTAFEHPQAADCLDRAATVLQQSIDLVE